MTSMVPGAKRGNEMRAPSFSWCSDSENQVLGAAFAESDPYFVHVLEKAMKHSVYTDDGPICSPAAVPFSVCMPFLLSKHSIDGSWQEPETLESSSETGLSYPCQCNELLDSGVVAR